MHSPTKAQSNLKAVIEKEIINIKAIPTNSHPDIQGKLDSVTVFDSSYSKIVSLGVKAIPVLFKWLYDTSYTPVKNPCWEEEPMRVHDIAWFLINEIEPIQEYYALKIVMCTWDQCSHFPQGFFNFIHSRPIIFATRYKKYFYSNQRKLILRGKIPK